MTFAQHISKLNRSRKFEIFINTFQPSKYDKILDVGYSNKEYSPNDNYLEKHYKYKHNIVAIGVEETEEFNTRYPEVKTIKYDGVKFPFKDNEFEIGWSNAVIEHVGDYKSQLNFLREINRTCKRVFFTTPNKLFPVEVHTRLPFLHFFPKKIFDRILMVIGKEWAVGNYMHLLTYRMIKRMLNELEIKNYKILRNKLIYFTLDFVIIIDNVQD